jgi:hypothetical protein
MPPTTKGSADDERDREHRHLRPVTDAHTAEPQPKRPARYSYAVLTPDERGEENSEPVE